MICFHIQRSYVQGQKSKWNGVRENFRVRNRIFGFRRRPKSCQKDQVTASKHTATHGPFRFRLRFGFPKSYNTLGSGSMLG